MPAAEKHWQSSPDNANYKSITGFVMGKKKIIKKRQNHSLSRIVSFLDMACKSYPGQDSSSFFLKNLDFIKKLETQGDTVAGEHMSLDE